MIEAHKKQFVEAAIRAGAQVVEVASAEEAARYVREQSQGTVVMPDFAASRRLGLAEALRGAGCDLVTENLRETAVRADAGVTGANFAIADTGTLVLESTAEDMRLATTLPERHFALLDPANIVADGMAAVPHMRAFHQRLPETYLAYITGPSRTADIERVLTIGVHGPRQLHILLLEGLGADPLEM